MRDSIWFDTSPIAAAKLVAARRSAGQRFEHEQAPLVADAVEHIANRTRLIEFDGAVGGRKRHDGMLFHGQYSVIVA